jgi:hypothetical protein
VVVLLLLLWLPAAGNDGVCAERRSGGAVGDMVGDMVSIVAGVVVVVVLRAGIVVVVAAGSLAQAVPSSGTSNEINDSKGLTKMAMKVRQNHRKDRMRQLQAQAKAQGDNKQPAQPSS